MQYFRDLTRAPRKSRCSRNRSVGGYFTFGNAPDRSLDAHAHVRRVIRGSIAPLLHPYTLSRHFSFLLHSAIHPMRISHNDPTETSSHRTIPCSSGLCPTRLMVAMEMPLPIKNNVAVSPIFAIFTARE